MSPLIPDSAPDDKGKSECVRERPLVIGGEPAELKEFPHMVKYLNNMLTKIKEKRRTKEGSFL